MNKRQIASTVAKVEQYCIKRGVRLTLIRRQVKSRFLRSFLFYVPYVTLAVMTFPAIIDATRVPMAGWMAFFGSILLAWRGWSIFAVSAAACAMVFGAEFLLLS